MDPVSIALPGAQALVAQILSEGWAQARGWLARRLGHSGDPAQAELERQLDTANAQASGLPVPETGVSGAAARQLVLEAYWTGYLAAQAGEHPGFAAALAELVKDRTSQPVPTTRNSVTGTVTGNVLQAGHIEGGVHFG